MQNGIRHVNQEHSKAEWRFIASGYTLSTVFVTKMTQQLDSACMPRSVRTAPAIVQATAISNVSHHLSFGSIFDVTNTLGKCVLFVSLLNLCRISKHQLNRGFCNKQIFLSKHCQMPKFLLEFICACDVCAPVCPLCVRVQEHKRVLACGGQRVSQAVSLSHSPPNVYTQSCNELGAQIFIAAWPASYRDSVVFAFSGCWESNLGSSFKWYKTLTH